MRQSKAKSSTATPKGKASAKKETSASKQGTLFGFLGKKEPEPVKEAQDESKQNMKPTESKNVKQSKAAS